jgi:ribosomal protein S18 acetylase RimI-like enzyme
MLDIQIRQVDPDDLAALREISRLTFQETFAAQNTAENMRKYLDDAFSTEKLSAELRDPGARFYFAIIHNDIVGYLKINFGSAQTELSDAHSMEIERIYVVKAYQGKQVAQKLYETAIVLARQAAVDFVWLGVWEENARAIRFYEKNGFVAFDRHIFTLGDDAQTDIMMKLDMRELHTLPGT